MSKGVKGEPAPEASNQEVVRPPVGARPPTVKLPRRELPKPLIYRIVLNFAAIPAVLTIAGFFVVHSYLASFTTLFTYNINITVYLAAGVNMAISILLRIAPPLVIGGASGFCLVPISIVLGAILMTIYARYRAKQKSLASMKLYIDGALKTKKSRFFFTALRLMDKASGYIICGVLALSILSMSMEYGKNSYGQSPRMYGGGQPAEVILIFKDADTLAAFPLPISASSSRRTEPIVYLLELSDGILIRDTVSNTVLVIKNDALEGIVDAHQSTSTP